MTEYRSDGRQKREMTEQDRSLCSLYWKLYPQVHTNPKLKPYFEALMVIMQKHGIKGADLNNFGLEMEMQRKEYNLE